MQSDHPHDAIFSVQPNSTEHAVLWLGQTHADALSVTVKRVQVVSSRELSVPVP